MSDASGTDVMNAADMLLLETTDSIAKDAEPSELTPIERCLDCPFWGMVDECMDVAEMTPRVPHTCPIHTGKATVNINGKFVSVNPVAVSTVDLIPTAQQRRRFRVPLEQRILHVDESLKAYLKKSRSNPSQE